MLWVDFNLTHNTHYTAYASLARTAASAFRFQPLELHVNPIELMTLLLSANF